MGFLCFYGGLALAPSRPGLLCTVQCAALSRQQLVSDDESSSSELHFDYLADQNESKLSRKSPGRYAIQQKSGLAESSATSATAAFSTADSTCSSIGEAVDSVTQLLKQLKNEPPMRSPLDKADLERLERMLKEKSKKAMFSHKVQQPSYTVDPKRLMPGEYVVHKNVGVGQFLDIKEEVPPGKSAPSKYLYLKYVDGMAKLPAKQARRLLYRYFREGQTVKKAPGLSRLKDKSLWEKRKNEGRLDAQTRVVKMIDVYVRRLKLKRAVYPKDSAAMTRFSAKFPYTPTPDQLKAFMDVERDMTERETPMDRLICGDVGFGKTEVAMRAIFHAVSAKKQVMVLAPTTVLAKQHFDIIRRRFADTKVALLSRFQTVPEKKQTIADLNSAKLQIIVGTHALLAKDINYRNVGLLVIDEEQRFGVAQKGKISSLKTTIDMLTLSATPIPRTLHMALSGFRDASLISTPPPERRPITTHVCVYSKDVIFRAISFELQRQGQVFYVVPRIQEMKETEKTLKSLFPQLRICSAHGKKTPTELEDAMQQFNDGEADVLLCTSIIESGIDIPAVNTIIIESVHMLGLAQIYQLRGRVGRANRAAHAYLLHPRKEFLNPQASERLNALEECCALGQGFLLAERDMEIRGIGSIFGEKQSGNVSRLGADLYAEMLFEALARAQFCSLPQLGYDDVHLATESAISNAIWETVYDDAVAAARDSLAALARFTEELRSERGKEPSSLEVILKLIFAKRMAADLGIHHIRTGPKEIIMHTNMDEETFKILHSSMTIEPLKNSLSFADGKLELMSLVELPSELQLERVFTCLADMRHGLPSFLTYR